MSKYIPGCGNPNARIMLVGEAPGQIEESQGFPFAGPTGKLVDDCLIENGVMRADVYATNVCKVRPPNNDLKQLGIIGHSIEEFLPQLYTEITTINPNVIIAIGDIALQYLTGFKGIKKYRGSILAAKQTGTKLVPTLHPASLMHREAEGGAGSWKELAYIKKDFQRAIRESAFAEIRLPERNLWIIRSSIELIRYLEKNAKNELVVLDVETINTWAQCIGLAFDDYEAVSIPLFLGSIPLHDRVYIWKILSDFLQDTKIKLIAQNAKFDEKRSRQLGLDWHDCYFDIAMGWHVLFSEFPKKLQFISSMITDEPYYKDEGALFDPRKHPIDRWLLYNAKDCVVEFECAVKIIAELKRQNLYDFYFDKIHPLHRLYSDIEDIGIRIDLEVNKHLKEKYTKARDERNEKLIRDIATENGAVDIQLYQTYKNFNVMSNGPKNQVAKLLFGYMGFPLRKDTADDTLKALANNHANKDERKRNILLGILEVRKLRKTISTYINAKSIEPDYHFFGPITGSVGDSPRIYTTCNTNGTESGRTSTGILQPPVYYTKAGIALQTMTKHEDITLSAGGGDLRSEFIADPGWSFIEPDLSQAEDRVVCVLAKDWDALESYKQKVFERNKHNLKKDRHTLTAMYVCGLGFDAVTDYERQIGKKARHAGNYNMGKHQHMITLGKYGVFISEYIAGKQLDRFHAENPKIRGVFHADIVQALKDNSCTLVSPHGRRRIFFNKWGEDLFKEAYAQLPQCTVSDQVKFAMLRIKKRVKDTYFNFLEESHDSFLARCKDEAVSDVLPIIKEEMEVPISFMNCTLKRDYDLVIPCEIKVGKRWIEVSEEWPDGMKLVKI
jgi:uracil-DNA glycosylase family 4